MAQCLYDITPLEPLINGGFTLLTPNQRLARRIKAEWDARQAAAGALVWETLSVQPLEPWLQQQWESASRQNLVPPLAPLAPAQALEIWRQVVEQYQSQSAEFHLLQPAAAAELASQRATDENFAALEEILRQSEERLARGESLAQLDRDFHLEIVRATQNTVFFRVCSVYYAMSEQRLPIYFNDIERGRKSHADHVQIYEALRRRDGNLAQALMSAHLQGAESYWKGLITGIKPIEAAE